MRTRAARAGACARVPPLQSARMVARAPVAAGVCRVFVVCRWALPDVSFDYYDVSFSVEAQAAAQVSEF